MVITGETGGRVRQNNIDAMNDARSKKRLLLCTSRTTAMGINLNLVDKIVLAELDYNSSVDLQASARASRIDNKKRVTCYRILTRGTIEERVYQIGTNKTIANRLSLDDHDLDQDFTGEVASVNDATALFGELCGVSNQSAAVRALEVHFKSTQQEEKKRWDLRKKTRREKEVKAKKTRLKFVKLLRRWLSKHGPTPTQILVVKFKVVCGKHGISQKGFRESLREAATFVAGCWSATNRGP